MPFINLSNQGNSAQGNPGEDLGDGANVLSVQKVQPSSELPEIKQVEEKQNNSVPNEIKPSLQENSQIGQRDLVSQVVEVKGPDFPNDSVNVQQSDQLETRLLSAQQPSDQPNTLVVNPNSSNISFPSGNLESKFSPQSNSIDVFLDITETRNASDLHLSVDYPPIIRVDGKLERLGSEVLQKKRAEELFKSLLNDKQWEKYLTDRELDFSYEHKTGNRFRINLYFEKGNMSGAFRSIPGNIRTVRELGLPEVLNQFAKLAHGLVLVTGPTGSGKSTTLAALLNDVNLNSPRHIITVEDPIEYVYPKARALVDQREIGKDSLSWTNALKYLLRQDPDVVLVGEMRDFETIAATITVAETGHLAFATLHTNSAAQTVDRIIDVFPEHQQGQIRAQLSVVLQAVISQRLVPLTGGGRTAVHEVLIATSAVRNAIRERKTYQIDNIIQTSAEVGMVTMEKSLVGIVRQGLVSLDAALEFTNKPDELKKLLGV